MENKRGGRVAKPLWEEMEKNLQKSSGEGVTKSVTGDVVATERAHAF